MSHTAGFTLIEVTVVAVIMALLGGGAYLYLARPQATSTPVAQATRPTVVAPQATNSAATPAQIQIQSNADLDTATQTLDNTDVDGGLDTSLTALDQDSSTF